MGVRVDQIALLGVEGTVVVLLVVGLFRQRASFGMALLFTVLGMFQLLQTVLAQSVYVEIANGLLVSPGSVVLFPATLFAVLLLYIREDANETRKLIYSIVASNVAMTALLMLFGLHFLSPATKNLLELPAELFAQNPRIVVIGTVALYIDVILVVLAYEAISLRFPKLPYLRIFGALAVTMWFDTIFFATGGFIERPEYVQILTSGLLGKTVAAAFYAGALLAYLRYFEGKQYLLVRRDGVVRDIFEILTFRQSHEAVREYAVRDGLTKMYNRDFFFDVLPSEIERSQRFGRPISLLRIDLDSFKQYNLAHGYPIGDRVLMAVAAAITETVRVYDVACRYEGDAFAVILPDCEGQAACQTAERLRARFAEFCRSADPPLPGRVTITVGVATYPVEVASTEQLLATADSRMEAGRRSGGDRVIGRDAEAA
jgi:diguanylate cyclase (GGDEF)-like protein